MGPNMKRLAIEKASADAIPANGGLADGLKFLSDPKRIIEGMRAGMKFAEDSVKAVREAADPNHWRNSTDEEIAGAILEKMEQTKAQYRSAPRRH